MKHKRVWLEQQWIGWIPICPCQPGSISVLGEPEGNWYFCRVGEAAKLGAKESRVVVLLIENAYIISRFKKCMWVWTKSKLFTKPRARRHWVAYFTINSRRRITDSLQVYPDDHFPPLCGNCCTVMDSMWKWISWRECSAWKSHRPFPPTVRLSLPEANLCTGPKKEMPVISLSASTPIILIQNWSIMLNRSPGPTAGG